MLVREIIQNVDGTVTERMVEQPGIVTVAEGLALDEVRVQAETNGQTLRQQAVAAMAGNKTFYQRANSSPDQQLAQLKAISRQSNGIIRLLLDRLEATD